MMRPQSGDLIEDLPSWLLDWRQHHLQRAQSRGESRSASGDCVLVACVLSFGALAVPVFSCLYIWGSCMFFLQMTFRKQLSLLMHARGTSLGVRFVFAGGVVGWLKLCLQGRGPREGFTSLKKTWTKGGLTATRQASWVFQACSRQFLVRLQDPDLPTERSC